MPVEKLSQVTPASVPPGLGDRIVGVSAANNDLLYTIAQIIAVFPSVRAINAQTSSYILQASDVAGVVLMNSGAANTLTVPPDSSVPFAVGTEIDVMQIGLGLTTFVAGAGVSLLSASMSLQMQGQYFGATLLKINTNVWTLAGGVAP